jgi:hypothetical protein
MEDWAIAQARDFIADAQTSGFDNAVIWRSLEKRSFGPLPINYGGVELFTALTFFPISGFSEQDMQSMSRNENFWRIAFSTALQTPSEPLVQGSNVLVLIPLDQTTAEEDAIERIALMYSSYWANYVSQQTIQYYFLTGVKDKMEDNFWDVYFRSIYNPY